ncbi:MAG: zinc ribbon domain-containing protein [Coriobacteriales bacterium]|nr:zinc ribbon domain-containing protein [Coriobacteriales bacterium]
MICKHCHQEISDDSRFCTYCGTVLDAPEPTIPAAPVTPVIPSAEPAYGSQETNYSSWQDSSSGSYTAPSYDPATSAPGYAAATSAPSAPAPSAAPGYAPAAPGSYDYTPATPATPEYAPAAPAAAPAAPAAAPGYTSPAAPDYAAPAAQPTPAPSYAPATQPAPAPSYAPTSQPAPAPDYAPAPIPAAPAVDYSQAPPMQQTYDPYQSTPQQQGQPSYAPQPVPYQAPPKKKKTWLIFLIIGILAACAIGVGIFVIVNFMNGGTTSGWSGGVASNELPSGYTAIVSNDYVVVGVGEVTPYYENDGTTTVQVDLYIINKSSNAIYLIFADNSFDGRVAPYDEVFVSVLRTEPGRTDSGVVYIEFLDGPDALNRWVGTLLVIDDDTYYDANPVILDEYDFDLTYNH